MQLPKLTNKQKRWAESYIRHFNATKATKEAGYDTESYGCLRAIGSENLSNPNIIAYIREVFKIDIDNTYENSIASLDEVLEFYSDGMRNKIKGKNGEDLEFSDRFKCATALERVHQLAKKNEDDELDEALSIQQVYGSGLNGD